MHKIHQNTTEKLKVNYFVTQIFIPSDTLLLIVYIYSANSNIHINYYFFTKVFMIMINDIHNHDHHTALSHAYITGLCLLMYTCIALLGAVMSIVITSMCYYFLWYSACI